MTKGKTFEENGSVANSLFSCTRNPQTPCIVLSADPVIEAFLDRCGGAESVAVRMIGKDVFRTRVDWCRIERSHSLFPDLFFYPSFKERPGKRNISFFSGKFLESARPLERRKRIYPQKRKIPASEESECGEYLLFSNQVADMPL